MAVHPIRTSMREIINKHRLFLVDNFGVLRNAKGHLPGVAETFAEIKRQGKTAIMVSNTANIPVSDLQKQLTEQGVELPESHIVTSGLMLAPYFARHGLTGKNILCLGNAVTFDYVRQAGGNVLDNTDIFRRLPGVSVDGVVIGWYPVIPPTEGRFGLISTEIIDAAVSVLRLRDNVRGVIANPDELAPYDEHRLIFCCGAIGKMIETCSGRILDRLGKPYQEIFELVLSRFADIPRAEVVMIGDTLDADSKGGKLAGIETVITLTGNTASYEEAAASQWAPNYVVSSFQLA